MDYDYPPDIESTGKKIVITLIAFILAAIVGFMGYRQIIKWHEQAVESAVVEQQQKMAERNADLEYQIIELRNKLATLKPSPVAEDRIEAVFGEPPTDTPTTPDHSCDATKQRISYFFNYLKQNAYIDESQVKQSPAEVYRQMVRALAANPPLIVDETRDIVNLKHNIAHFYRVLKKDKIEMIKTILAMEDDILERAMADFYAYYVSGDCCKEDAESCISLNTLYEYAGFFTSTFAGKGYLFRRQSTIRCLMEYYAVLILDKANEAGINSYGIDIRPQIDLALDNIINQNSLVFQNQYMDKLYGLQEKYAF